MAGEILRLTDAGCVTALPNGTSGQVLGIQENGLPGYIAGGAGGASISADAGNLLAAGVDGGIYLDNERVQDAVGLAIAAGLGLTYNDALNAISGALATPVTSGAGVPPATSGSPTIYTDTLTSEIYYRDSAGTRVKIYSPTVSTDASNILVNGTDHKPYLTAEAVQDIIGTAVAAGVGLSYNDTANSLSGSLPIPLISGTGIPASTPNSPEIFHDTSTGDIYYRDTAGNVMQINSVSGGVVVVSANAGNKLTSGTDSGAYLSCAVIQDCIETVLADDGSDIVAALTARFAIPALSGAGDPVTIPDGPYIYTDTITGIITYTDPDGNLVQVNHGAFTDDPDNLIKYGVDDQLLVDRRDIYDTMSSTIGTLSGLDFPFPGSNMNLDGRKLPAAANPLPPGVLFLVANDGANNAASKASVAEVAAAIGATVGGGVSSDSGNLISAGTDFGAFLACETVQDCIGAAVAAGTGLVYSDVSNSLSTTGGGTAPPMEYYSRDYGVVGDGVTDDGPAIQAMFDAVGAAGGGYCILASLTPGSSIYYNVVVSCYYSNVHIVSRSPMICGADGSLRIFGTLDEYTRRLDGVAIKLRSDSTLDGSGRTVLHLSASDGALLEGATPGTEIIRQNDKITVRGKNNFTGRAVDKDDTFVVAVTRISANTFDVTCSEALSFTPLETYVGSPWNPGGTGDHTTIYIDNGSALALNASVNDMTVTVVDGSVFAVGQYAKLSSNLTENTKNAATTTVNPANLEMCQIKGISGNVITLDHAICFDYLTTDQAFLAIIIPVVNSTISNVRLTWNADQTSKSVNAFNINYGVNCAIFDCEEDGSGGRKGQGLRISYSYNCHSFRNSLRDPKFTDSGEGYGFTLYYCTLCTHHNNFSSGHRHNYLTQLATMFAIYNNESVDDRISGIDCHGVWSKRGLIMGNRISRTNRHTTDSTNGSGCRNGNTTHKGGDFEIAWIGNFISGYTEVNSSGLDFLACSSGITYIGNVIKDCYTGIKFTFNNASTPAQQASGVKIIGNEFKNCVNKCVTVTAQTSTAGSNGTVDKLSILRNISSGNAHHFEFTANGGITNLLIRNNDVVDPVATSGVHGIDANGVVGLQIYNNNLHGCNKGIKLTNCTGPAEMVGNILTGMVDSVAYTDGGGNTSLLHEYNTGYDAVGGGGGGGIIRTKVDGTLSASTTSTAAIAHNNSAPVITDGLQAVSVSYSPASAGASIRVTGWINYIQTSVTSPVQMTLWAGSVCIGMITQRITTGGSSGGGIVVDGVFTSVSTSAVTIQLRVGPDVNTTTITLRSKFGGLDQPYLIIEEV